MDTLRKNTESMKFHEHMEIIIEGRQPQYSKNNSSQKDKTNLSLFLVCRKLFLTDEISL